MVYVADEPTGGTHFSLVIAGAYKMSFADAEIYKRDKKNHKELLPVLKPVIEKGFIHYQPPYRRLGGGWDLSGRRHLLPDRNRGNH